MIRTYKSTRKATVKRSVIVIPRMTKSKKTEWRLFLNERNRICYNELCRRCGNNCKQSFRVVVISCNYTASPARVAPRRVPKMAPFIQSGTTLLFRRRVARVFFCFCDLYIINQKSFSKYPLETEFVFKIVLTIRSALFIIDNTKISALAVNQIEFRKDCELCTMSNIIRAYSISTAA